MKGQNILAADILGHVKITTANNLRNQFSIIIDLTRGLGGLLDLIYIRLLPNDDTFLTLCSIDANNTDAINLLHEI